MELVLSLDRIKITIMINTEDKKAVIYNAINSAICIDDQYESPYCDIPETGNILMIQKKCICHLGEMENVILTYINFEIMMDSILIKIFC